MPKVDPKVQAEFEGLERSMRERVSAEHLPTMSDTILFEKPKAYYKQLINQLVMYSETGRAIRGKFGTYRERVREGVRPGSDNRFDTVMKLMEIIRVGWRAGLTTSDIRSELGVDKRKADSKKEQRVSGKDLALEFFDAALIALRSEIASMDAEGEYGKFIARTRHIIENIEKQAMMIQAYWESGAARREKWVASYVEQNGCEPTDIPDFGQMDMHKEHAVLWKMIFDIEKDVIKTGMDMGVLGAKGDDKTIVLQTYELLPEELTKELDPRNAKDRLDEKARQFRVSKEKTQDQLAIEAVIGS